MFFLLVFGIFCVWRIYSSLKEDERVPKPTLPSPVVKHPRRLQLETMIRKIAGNDVSQEKMDALTFEAPHVLVTARAGSGKTTTIAIRTALAVHQGVRPEQTLSICFNKSAAMELGARIAKYGVHDAPTATFHSLAYAIVQPRHGSLVCGERQRSLMRQLLSRDTEKRGKRTEKEEEELVDDLLTFISSAKHKGLYVEDVQARYGNAGGIASQAVSVYAAYEQHLERHRILDFDNLLQSATEKLRTSPRLPVIRLAEKACDLNSLRLLTIDESQDLSRSFYGLMKILMDRNSYMGVYAVGDSWQAINSFAGSNLSFFNHFESYFPGGKRAQLQTNYRSCRAVVDYSNRWMKGLGEGGVAIREGGSVEHVKTSGGAGGLSVHQMLRELVARERGRSIMVLARRNVCHDIELEEWQKDLSRFNPNVRVSSVHKSKGGEADTVFFLKEPATKGRTSHLNAILGVTKAETLEEERRIEYVALTRARGRLVVIE